MFTDDSAGQVRLKKNTRNYETAKISPCQATILNLGGERKPVRNQVVHLITGEHLIPLLDCRILEHLRYSYSTVVKLLLTTQPGVHKLWLECKQ